MGISISGISISNFDDPKTKVGKYRHLPLPFKFPNVKNMANNRFKSYVNLGAFMLSSDYKVLIVNSLSSRGGPISFFMRSLFEFILVPACPG